MSRYFGRVDCGIACFVLAIGLFSTLPQARAVGVSTSTYAKDATNAAPVTFSQNLSDPVNISSNILSSRPSANAQAWATSQVTAAGVVKSASGRSWVTAGNDLKSTSWSSYATGTVITPHYTGPADVNNDGRVDGTDAALLAAGLDVPFNLIIPKNFSDPNAPTNITSFPVPSQGMFNDGTRVPGGAPSFFDVFYRIDATLTPINASGGTGTPIQLFHGTLELDPNGNFVRGGNFSSTFFTNSFSLNTTAGRSSVSLPEDLALASTVLKSDQNYDLTFNVFTSMGDNTHPGGVQSPPTDFNFSSTNLTTAAGGGGSFASQFFVDPSQQSNFTVMTVPEPESWVMLGMGAIGLAWFVRRQSRLVRA